MQYTPFTVALAVVPAILQAEVAHQMIARRLIREFPVFFAYTVFHVLSISVTLASSFASELTYFYVYWGFQLIDIFMSLGLVRELFHHVFKPFSGLRSVGDGLFQWATIVLCGITILTSSAASGVDSSRTMSAILAFSRSANFLVLALLGLLFGLVGAIGIKWQGRGLRISLGLAVLAAVASAATAIRSQLGEIAHPMLSLITPLAYNVACGFWISAVYAESPTRLLSEKRFRRLSDWSKAIEEISGR